ncbi:MAG: hypothetical protein P4K83_12135 [Terracidiphilus sp.]|nr:hypothetical protein [Terracidiphilus sp.]
MNHGLRLVLVFLFYSVTAQLFGQAAGSSALPDRIRIEPVRELRNGLNLWPLIANPRTDAERRINETLSAMNLRLRGSVRKCDADYQLWDRVVNEGQKHASSPHGDWERKVEVTMAGPRYLSLVVEDGIIFCGSPYPNHDDSAFVFDLESGKLVDPIIWLTSTEGASTNKEANWEGSSTNLLILPALQEMSLARATDECKDVFGKAQAYFVWLDARKNRLIAFPSIQPHVVQGCAERLELTADQTHALGFKDDLLQAIEAGHRRLNSRKSR